MISLRSIRRAACVISVLLASATWGTEYIYDSKGHIKTIVDANGIERIVNPSDYPVAQPLSIKPQSQPPEGGRALSSNPSRQAGSDDQSVRMSTNLINRMRPGTVNSNYFPFLPISVIGFGADYTLDSGENVFNGSFNYDPGQLLISSVEVQGDQVIYTFIPFGNDPLTDFSDFGNQTFSTEGILAVDGTVSMVATIGSSVAVMSGALEIISNAPETVPSSTFTRFASIEGAVVPFTVELTLSSAAWAPDSFETQLNYSTSNFEIDFQNPSSEPLLESVEMLGAAQIPPNAQVAFTLQGNFTGGYTANVSSLAQWSVTPDDIVSISQTGVINTTTAPAQDTAITVTAQYLGFSDSISSVIVSQQTIDTAELYDWSTYQGGSGQTGYKPFRIEQSNFPIKWQIDVPGVGTWSPVASSGDLIYVSYRNTSGTGDDLYAIDAKNGEIIWSRDFGGINYIGYPATAYGNVFLHTGYVSGINSDFFYSVNGTTGADNFSTALPREFENFGAPVIVDGSAYLVNEPDSSSGEMVRIDATSGTVSWSSDVSAEFQMTPTVFDDRIVVGFLEFIEVIDRETGEELFRFQNPDNPDSISSRGRSLVRAGENSVISVNGNSMTKINIQTPPSIEWSIVDTFRTTAAVSEESVYVATFDEFRVYDLLTGDLQWSIPRQGFSNFSANSMVATLTHAFFGNSSGETYVVDLSTRSIVRTISTGGALSIANEHLYIAGSSGVLVAVDLPTIIDEVPTSIEIEGPSEVTEFSTSSYQVNVTYPNGLVRDRTVLSDWSLKASEVASLSSGGVLSVGEITSPSMTLSIGAQYTEDGVTLKASLPVTLTTLLTDTEFSLRSLDDAKLLEESILQQLDDVNRRLNIGRNGLIDQMSGDAQTALQRVDQAILDQLESKENLMQSLQEVQQAIDILEGTNPTRNK